MDILTEHGWTPGFLDYAPLPGHRRIRVMVWKTLAIVDGLYFVPSRNWRTVYNYLLEVGLLEVWKKARSRSQESLRNQKFISCGIGRLVPSADEEGHVVFVAPCHPRCIDQVVLPDSLLKRAQLPDRLESLPPDRLHYFGLDQSRQAAGRHWPGLAGWSPCSGSVLAEKRADAALDECLDVLLAQDLEQAEKLPVQKDRPVRSSKRKEKPQAPQLKAVLFGYGHYAKTNIIPNLPDRIQVNRVHEIDPAQIGLVSDFPFSADTSPQPSSDLEADVFFIAGFHHTHAPLAVEALERGAAAVVEKPLATTRPQLEELRRALENTQGRLFAGFHKRYWDSNAMALRDLDCQPGDPVHYHCIVYEVPLPRRHWYRWPNSGSRMLSNGCHWVDHFLFLNRFSRVAHWDLWAAANGDLTALAELENGASFSMTLTEAGSPRVGLREYIELRKGDRAVSIRDASRYQSESRDRILRSKRLPKYNYRTMYRRIAERILSAAPGDSPQSLLASAELVLDFEERLQRMAE